MLLAARADPPADLGVQARLDVGQQALLADRIPMVGGNRRVSTGQCHGGFPLKVKGFLLKMHGGFGNSIPDKEQLPAQFQ